MLVPPRAAMEEGKGRSRTEQKQSLSCATFRAEALPNAPKGKSGMKQERSQLNICLPATLKRQASAKLCSRAGTLEKTSKSSCEAISIQNASKFSMLIN